VAEDSKITPEENRDVERLFDELRRQCDKCAGWMSEDPDDVITYDGELDLRAILRFVRSLKDSPC